MTVWGKQGENCASYLEKGRPVAIDGRLEWREYTKEGESSPRQAVEIVADSVQFLGGRDSSTESGSVSPPTTGGGGPTGTSHPDDDVPF